MNDDELASLLNTLEQGLSENGLPSLVAQERISAFEGKAEKLTTQDLVELRYEWSRRGRGRAPRIRADDVRVRPLTVGERLAELLDLVEAAVAGTYSIEMRLRDDLKAALDVENSTWSGEVMFEDPPESEVSGVTSGGWTLPDQTTLRQREAAVREVILLVSQLREQTQLSRSDLLHSTSIPDGIASADVDLPADWS